MQFVIWDLAVVNSFESYRYNVEYVGGGWGRSCRGCEEVMGIFFLVMGENFSYL